MLARLQWLIACVVVIWSLASNLSAQSLDFDAWEQLASTTERQLLDLETQDVVFEALRSSLVEWRLELRSAAVQHTDRLTTIEAQLAALEAEAEVASDLELQARIDDLRVTRNALRLPQLQAAEALSRADGLIAEIDTQLRSRQSRIALARSESPLWPGSWGSSLQSLLTSLRDDLQLSEGRWSTMSVPQRGEHIALAFLGLSLLIGSMILVTRANDWVHSMSRMRAAPALLSVAAILQLVLGLAGAAMLVQAIREPLGLGGDTAELRDLMLRWAAGFVVLFWLSKRLTFQGAAGPVLDLRPAQRFGLSVWVLMCMLWVIAQRWVSVVAERDAFTIDTSSDIGFWLAALGCAVLLGLSGVLRKSLPPSDASTDEISDSEESEETAVSYRMQVTKLALRAVLVLVGIAFIAAAIGYVNLANLILLATMRSLALIGAIMVAQRMCEDLASWVFGRSGSLLPILAGFGFSIAALPIFARIWGAQHSDLIRIWEQALSGFSIGETRLSLTNLATFLTVFTAIYFATRIVQSSMRGTVLPKTSLDMGAQTALVSGLGYIGIGLALIIGVTAAGINLSGLGIIIGALSVGIGFGLQTVVSNFVSGIILLIERPISDGDWIEVGGQMGYVRKISVRATTIETFDRTNVIVPNADLVSGQVINWTKSSTVGRLVVPVRVAIDSDTEQVARVLSEAACAHPNVMLNPPPTITFQGIERDALLFEARLILRDVNWMLDVRNTVNHEIIKRFRDEDIKIPRPQQDVWLQERELSRS